MADVDKLLDERGKEYGNAWYVTNEVLSFLDNYQGFRDLLRRGVFLCWVMVINKAVRAMFSPTKIDHWRDIEGWARLARNHLERVEEGNAPPVSPMPDEHSPR